MGVSLSFRLSSPYQEQLDICNGSSRSFHKESRGVPTTVAKIIKTKVLVNDYSIFKVREGENSLRNSNPSLV